MVPLFRWGLGGRLGNGNQWMPWVHLIDVIRLIEFAISNDRVVGPLHATAPQPVTNREFTSALAKALRRVALLPAPRAALRMALGEFADALLASQRVVPTAAIEAGFEFQFPTLDVALRDLLGDNH